MKKHEKIFLQFMPATLPLVSRVGGQRITLRHVSNRPSPNQCLPVSAHTALQTWIVVCLDRLSPLLVRGIHRTVADISIVLRPFPVSQTLP